MFERWCPWLRRPYPLSVDRFLHTSVSQRVTSLAWSDMSKDVQHLLEVACAHEKKRQLAQKVLDVFAGEEWLDDLVDRHAVLFQSLSPIWSSWETSGDAVRLLLRHWQQWDRLQYYHYLKENQKHAAPAFWLGFTPWERLDIVKHLPGTAAIYEKAGGHLTSSEKAAYVEGLQGSFDRSPPPSVAHDTVFRGIHYPYASHWRLSGDDRRLLIQQVVALAPTIDTLATKESYLLNEYWLWVLAQPYDDIFTFFVRFFVTGMVYETVQGSHPRTVIFHHVHLSAYNIHVELPDAVLPTLRYYITYIDYYQMENLFLALIVPDITKRTMLETLKTTYRYSPDRLYGTFRHEL